MRYRTRISLVQLPSIDASGLTISMDGTRSPLPLRLRVCGTHDTLSGVRCCDIFHNGANYELAYHVVYKGDERVIILLAGTRENFHEELKSYWDNAKRRLFVARQWQLLSKPMP